METEVDATPISQLVLNPRTVLATTLTITALLFVLHIPQIVLTAQSDEPVRGLSTRFDLGNDTAVPTWFAAAFLALAAVGLVWIAALSRSSDRVNTYHWSALAAIFFGLSIDEVAAFHEAFGRLDMVSGHSGVLSYGWVIGGIAFVVVVGVAYLPFLARIDARTRTLFVLSGVIYVSGVLGMEMLNASLASAEGEQTWRYALQTAVEETAEFAGVSVFLYSIADHLRRRGADIVIRLSE